MRTPAKDPIGLFRCQVRSTSVLEPRSASREASSTSLSQYALGEGFVSGQLWSSETVGPGVAAAWPVAEGRTADLMGTAVDNDTTGTVPDGLSQAPHSSANPAATNFHPQRPMTCPSDGQHDTVATPQSRLIVVTQMSPELTAWLLEQSAAVILLGAALIYDHHQQ